MTNTELKSIRKALDLSKTDFARAIGISPVMEGKYEKGSREIPDEVGQAAYELLNTADQEPDPVVDEEDVRTVLSSCLPTEHICELHSLITFNRGVIEEAGLIPFVDGRDADKTSAEVYAVEDLVVSETIFFLKKQQLWLKRLRQRKRKPQSPLTPPLRKMMRISQIGERLPFRLSCPRC